MTITAPPIVDALPEPPNPADRLTFNAKAYPWSLALGSMTTDMNAIASWTYSAATQVESTASQVESTASQVESTASQVQSAAEAVQNTSGTYLTFAATLTIATGTQSITISTGKSYATGQFIIIANTATPSTYMSGQIISYNSGTGTLVVNITVVAGSGSVSGTWALSLTANPDAAFVKNTPAGNIVSTTVQAAIDELDGEKLSKSGGTMTGDLSVPSLNGGQLAGFRNKIINGRMDISQRNGGTVMALTDTPTYFNDRWSCVSSSVPSGNLFTGRTTITGALGSAQLGDGFENFMYFQRQSGTYTGFARAIQVLETVETLSLAGRTVTLSFWAAVNTGWRGGNLTASILTGTGTDQTAVQFFAGTATGQATANSTTVTLTTTLTKFSVQATIPLGTKQVAVLIQNTGWSGSGSSPDIVGITGIQLEVGSVATPFEHRHYGMELALCQRYYYRTTNNGGSIAYVGLLGGISASRAIGSAVTTPQTMRSAVSQFEYSGLSVHALSTSSVGPVTTASIYGDIRGPSHSLDINVASGLSVGTPYMLGIAPNGFIGFSAEL